MMSFSAMFMMQARRLCTRAEARWALTALLLVVVAALIESALQFYGADVAELPSAATGWVGNMDVMQIQSMHVFYFYLIFLIAALGFADNFFVDVKSGMANKLATRSSLRSYVASTALVAFLAGFLLVFCALALSQLLAFAVFPASAGQNAFTGPLNTPAADSTWTLLYADRALFPDLYFNHPYLDNAVFILYASLWAGLMSLASFAVSLYTRKSRLIVIGAPTLVFLVSFFVLPFSFALPYYLYPQVLYSGLTPAFFALAPLAVLAAALGAVAFALRRRKDVLL